SMEKTKVTHANDGFDFLGFHLRRCMGETGMGVKTTISDKAYRKHLEYLRTATAPTTHADPSALKILALNRAIAGWCRYFQYTSKAAVQFHEMDYHTFWLVIRWLATKHRLSVPRTIRRFKQGSTLAVEGQRLLLHTSFPTLRYIGRFFKPNPYTHQETVEREQFRDTPLWTGFEARPGMVDLRPLVLARDGYRCCICKEPVTETTCQVDHLRPYSCFKRPVDANRLENLWTLCIPCHQKKTEADRQRESRMP